ncbi:MAG: malto-oligosyltrehalose synthase [Pseudomonadota bacterium]
MTPSDIPVATYRLQFNRDFTFVDALHIIPYLHQLGISHVYASPILKARAGSPHGYDIVDHDSLNPELGTETEFDAFVECLQQHGMGLILDIVPNHMGVGGDDNHWWLDVLEHGEASIYAPCFDIDWHPVNPVLRNKVLLPFLADDYGSVLEQGALRLELVVEHGTFHVRYFEHLFPIDPGTYSRIGQHRDDVLEQRLASEHDILAGFRSFLSACRKLPRRTGNAPEVRQKRRHAADQCKRDLASLCQRSPALTAFLQETVAVLNGDLARPDSFDALHELLEAQAYRLAYWQVATDEINYRRFFDINELAGIRMDNDEVFESTHRLIRRLIGNEQINGLRVDHPDGLSDPHKYFRDLQNVASASGERSENTRPCYILVEKILAEHERLPEDWPVDGTTGYEAAHLLNGLFVFPGGRRTLDLLYRRITQQQAGFDELLHERKKLIIHAVLSGELTVLANLLSGIAQADRHTRDFTYHGLRDAIGEVVACFPVYRSYIRAGRVSEQDRRHIEWAIARAKRRSPASNARITDFIGDLLLFRHHAAYAANIQRRIIEFILRFQQYTAPVMAKGLEDTGFYVYNRLVSLNDVGFNPDTFGISPHAFHQQNRLRRAEWPHAMVNTSTHDSKRGEDVRARINVISEVPDAWRRQVARWSRLNRGRKRPVDNVPAPSRNDEYLFYQTLFGTWPLTSPDEPALSAYRARIEAYMLKAAREAKVHTSWINTGEAYEAALRHFVQTALQDSGHNAFLAEFAAFQQPLAHCGLLQSLSQTLLKLTIPGVPDIYQGNDLWCFDLVDPDNRHAVDYAQRMAALRSLMQTSDGGSRTDLCRELLAQPEDGRAKLYVTWQALTLRNRFPQLFRDGDYLALDTDGTRAEHLVAFARRSGGAEVIVVAVRWFARLPVAGRDTPPGTDCWADTSVELPPGAPAATWRNVLTNEPITPFLRGSECRLAAADLLRDFPLALLVRE